VTRVESAGSDVIVCTAFILRLLFRVRCNRSGIVSTVLKAERLPNVGARVQHNAASGLL